MGQDKAREVVQVDGAAVLVSYAKQEPTCYLVREMTVGNFSIRRGYVYQNQNGSWRGETCTKTKVCQTEKTRRAAAAKVVAQARAEATEVLGT